MMAFNKRQLNERREGRGAHKRESTAEGGRDTGADESAAGEE
jgi:hypothetical protein